MPADVRDLFHFELKASFYRNVPDAQFHPIDLSLKYWNCSLEHKIIAITVFDDSILIAIFKIG